ncbi:claspin-like [Ptychodera flava]|uniref:claspin-like n=1 Tax=Ptychodera flava TaxID=63121 RepID=UPI00396A16A3
MGIEGIEMEAEEADNESEEDEDNDNTDADTIDASESAKVKDNRNGESMKLKLDNSIRSDPSNSSSSFKTPAKANTSSSNTTHSDTQTPVAHISTETMNLFDSTSSLPGDGNESRKAQEKNGTVEGFNFSAIKQKKGLIKHKSMDFGEYEDFLSDGDGDLVKFLENDQGEKDMKNTSLNSLDTSLDIGSTIPAYQPGGGTTGHHQEKSSIGRNSPDLFTPWKRGDNTCTSSLQKSTSKLSELTLPVEDSQDLFNSPPQLDISQHSSSQKQLSDAESQSFHFSLDNETQSQFLDEHGFLNVQSSSKPKTSKRQLKLSVESDTSQEGMDELLGLCSGKFAEDTQESNASSAKGSTASKGRSLFSRFSSDLGTSSQRSNIDELLGLCSGTFTENTQKKADGEDTDAHKDKDDNDDNESVASFHIMSDVEDKDEEEEITKKREKKMNRAIAFSDEEDDDGDDNDDGMEGDLEDELDEDEQADLVKKQRLLNKFIEDEAELSGSDVGSDDELEDAADDEYEEEAIEEELLPEEDLKNQINRIHMKTMEDEDARRLRLYQEMYLQDGDLWTDGKGRTRRFRWNNMDDDASEMDMFRKDSDGEVSDNETELELKWRKERYERERWLEEQRKEKKAEEEDVDVDENSQFTKIIKNIEKKKKVIPEETITMDTKEKTANTSMAKGAGTPKPVHQTMFRRGSFLCKSKEDLDKIAALTKPLSNPNGPKYSRNFVFQSRSPPKEDAMKKPQVRRSISVSGSASQPVSKRPRLDRSLSTETKHSIFNHF